MKKIMDGNEACSYHAYHFTEVAGIYPITPASTMAENVSRWSDEQKLNYFDMPVEVVEMESEAGAIGMVHGALQSGCLSSTFTASQGLLLMIPNMYKIAGELLPCVIHVAARSLSTHALSIFGDHQDVYATRATGFAILASSSVQDVMDLTSVSYLSAIKGRIPFLNFFDGFRTSHEMQKIDVIEKEDIKSLIDFKSLQDFRSRALNPLHPVSRGTSQSEEVYFQATEVRNEYYDKLPDIVAQYMEDIQKLTGRVYQPFNYYGSKNASKVIVAMGSVCEVVKEVVDYLVDEKNQNVGLIEVHLYRPFSTKYFLSALPKSVKKIAVLDRTKEAGSSGEPLYLDVVKVMNEADSKVKVVGGRYGLSSKDTTPAMIKGVYDFLDKKEVHHNFTVGILDDVTNLSIPYEKSFQLPSSSIDFLVYGYGSDGMVSASKDLLKITGNHTRAYVQGYFQYDSKKSGGHTVCHLRFDKNPIRSTYYIEKASLIVCTQDSYLKKLSMLDKIKSNGIFLLNTNKKQAEILSMMSDHDKQILQNKNVRMYVIDANKIAKEEGIPGKISIIMESLIFKLGKVIDFTFAKEVIKDNLRVRFQYKSGDLASKNIKAMEKALTCYTSIEIPNLSYDLEKEEKKTDFERMNAMDGNQLPVSSFLKNPDGSFESGTTKYEKRDISDFIPCYHSENCISCNLCSLVCPHAVIRPFLLDQNEVMDAPDIVRKRLIDPKIKDVDYQYTIGISVPDCTGCGLCVDICPGKRGNKALTLEEKANLEKKEEEISYSYLFQEVSEKNVMEVSTVKGSQFKTPKFEFSGACAGCGETAYLKLLTQLFGDRLMIANATGCSSIYGATAPNMSYSVPWANSLFEDNAEYGYGMKIADLHMKNRIIKLIKENIKNVKKSEQATYKAYVKEQNLKNSKNLFQIIDSTKIEELKKLKEFILPRSIWMIGGDGWAYDIGFNGVDHVLASKENVNLLVLDTEVYSNTGGQTSKSTRVGAVAKFSNRGKETAKKDLLKIALTYPHVYVASISLGANPAQAIKVLKEAEEYDGPSIIVAYAPCIAQGIIKGMKNSLREEKEATACGYFPIFHYHPEFEEFRVDSKADFTKYYEFILGEDRYRQLKSLSKDYKEKLEQNKKNAEKRYQDYKNLEKLSNEK